MQEVLIKRKQERYAEYGEEVEIAHGELESVKLYPTQEVICDLYAIPSDNHQAFYAMVYQEESGYQMVYAKPHIYYPKEHEWTRMYGFRECKEVIREQMQHGSILQGRIVVGIKALPNEFMELLYDLRENVPAKSILEGNRIVLHDGVFQAIRFLEQGQAVKEAVYEVAEQVPVGKKELVKELENLYLTVERIIG